MVPGILAVLSFLVLVQDPGHSPNPALKFWSALRDLPLRFKSYLGAVGLFGVGDFSHTLLILAATQLLTPVMGVSRAAQAAGILYVLRNLVQVIASYPVGTLADRRGALPVLAGGYVLGTLTAMLTAAAFWFPMERMPVLVAIFILAGLYMAVQEALEAVVTADLVAPDQLGMSYGSLGTVNGTAKLISSSLVGIVWTTVSPALGFGLAAFFMGAGTLAMGIVKRTA
jgi:MFS family permease